MKDKKEYVAPSLTVVTFKSERGYAQSLGKQYLKLTSAFLGNSLTIESSQELWANDELTFGADW